MPTELTTGELNDLLTMSPAIPYVCEPWGGYPVTFVGENVEHRLGYAADDFLRDVDFWASRLHPQDLNRILEERPVVFEKGHCNLEYRFRHKDGSYRWVHDELRLLRDEEGKVEKIAGFWIDVTRRKQADDRLREERAALEESVHLQTEELARELAEKGQMETALQESEAQVRLIVDSLPVLINHLDTDLRYTLVNDTAARWYARPREEIIGKRPQDIFGSQLKNWRDHLDKALAGQEVSDERKVAYPDGVTRDIRSIYVPNIAADGSVRGIFSLTEDITEYKKIENDLRRRERELRLIVDSLPVLITYMDAQDGDLRYVMINRTGTEWYARPAAALVGKRPVDVLGTQLQGWQHQLDAALHGREVTFEHRIEYPDGVTRDVRLIYVPNIGSNGAVHGIFALVEDMTEDKAVAEQLRRSQKLEAIGQVVGGVAHEFNNLLMAISGNIELLIERDLREMPAATRQAKRVLESVLRGKGLTGHLLSYTGNPFNRPLTIDTGEAVSRAVSFLRPVLGETIELVAKVPSHLWPIHVDPGEFENALTNLAINARDAMPEGGTITVTVANSYVDAELTVTPRFTVVPGEYVAISVRDTGSGIPSEIVERIFDPFFTTKEVGKGTGLGLSMVYGFVHHQSGGFVDIRTAENQGAEITMYFPQATGGQDLLRDSGAQSQSDASVILLVEDDIHVRDMMTALLELSGHNVLPAANGSEAMAIVKAEPRIDLLISDVILPGRIGGSDIAEYVRESLPETKVILISGYTETELAERGIPEGRYRLLKKPFLREDLEAAVGAALAETGAKPQ